MPTLSFSNSNDQLDTTKEAGKCIIHAYELLRILNPEKNRSNDLIGCISNIGDSYRMLAKKFMHHDN